MNRTKEEDTGEEASWSQGTLQRLITLGQRGIVLLHNQTHAEQNSIRHPKHIQSSPSARCLGTN